MSAELFCYDWQDLAFASKKPINSLRPIFIVAPREISQLRFKQLIKTYLPQGNIILGLAKEQYVFGFEGQPQFKMQQESPLNKIITQVNNSKLKNKIYQLHYRQRDLKYLFEQLDFKKVILVNGSWKYAWHTQVSYYVLVNKKTDYELVSPFCDEPEALSFERKVKNKIIATNPVLPGKYSIPDMMRQTDLASHYSYDYSFQTGAVLGQQSPTDKSKYKLLAWSFNKVVPFQTYAMHYGSSREKHFSPPNDLNYYDTVHAEVMLILQAQRQGIKLVGTTLFTNLLPCPNCARMLCETPIVEFVYANDHSEGYAQQLLQAAGKNIWRLVI
ncbi:MAG TPA: deaminase [Candidatus Saccharimonadales bacterium]|jgi:deoxycytidylate deaminase|nr:deaminase [Candidatus Saccharimonadales bacterium]